MLVNNVLLMVAAGSVLLGTLYPLIVDALGLGKLSVGPPYFNAVFMPLMLPLLFLMAVGPLARWKQADVQDMARRLRLAALIAFVVGVGVPLLLGPWTPLAALGVSLAVWIAASTFFQVGERLKSGWPPRSFWGMPAGHLGIAGFVVGVRVGKGYEGAKDVRMAFGERIQLA